jgi:CRISPR-associated endonuclease/helicase Cas3
VDIDFPIAFQALAPADSLQQTAGRVNREGLLPEPGRCVIFRAADAGQPIDYDTPVGETTLCFGPGRDPDNLAALEDYYLGLYSSQNTVRNQRSLMIQHNREKLDFEAVAHGPLRGAGDPSGGRNPNLAFRMIDDDTVPVVVTGYDDGGKAAELLKQLRAPKGDRRETYRKLQRYTVVLPHAVVDRHKADGRCKRVFDNPNELWEWCGSYDPDLGIDEDQHTNG